MYDHDFIARWVESAMYVADTVLGLKSYMTTEYNPNGRINPYFVHENKLNKIVAESVKRVLKEEGIFKKSPSLSSEGDERLAVKNAIHELTETVSILNKFLENGMMEKRLLEMADTYCQRGYSHIANLIKLAN